jgi:hypothetical protein
MNSWLLAPLTRNIFFLIFKKNPAALGSINEIRIPAHKYEGMFSL